MRTAGTRDRAQDLQLKLEQGAIAGIGRNFYIQGLSASAIRWNDCSIAIHVGRHDGFVRPDHDALWVMAAGLAPRIAARLARGQPQGRAKGDGNTENGVLWVGGIENANSERREGLAG
jgi:hypothetical protein